MKTSLINKKIVQHLQSIADEGTFYMRKKSGGHPVCIASYGGEQRSFSLASSPNREYYNYMRSRVNRFIRTLPIQPTTFNL